jgi:hypothetical protein
MWLLCCLWLWGIAASVSAQSGSPATADTAALTALHVTGQARLTQANKPIASGQKFKNTDAISFGDRHSKVIAWHPTRGLLSFHPQAEASPKAGLQGPAASFGNAATPLNHAARLEHFSTTMGLKPHFQGRKYLVLGKSWLIADPAFKPEGDTLILLKYRNIKQNFQTGHRIEFKGDSLQIDPKSMLDLNGKLLDARELSDYRLWWYSLSNKKSGEITYLEFVFADEAQVEEEVKLLCRLMQDKPGPAQVQWARLFVEIAFGEADAHNYDRWMAAHFPDLGKVKVDAATPASNPAEGKRDKKPKAAKSKK